MAGREFNDLEQRLRNLKTDNLPSPSSPPAQPPPLQPSFQPPPPSLGGENIDSGLAELGLQVIEGTCSRKLHENIHEMLDMPGKYRHLKELRSSKSSWRN